MTSDTLNTPLFENTHPSLARPVPAALVGARADVIVAANAQLLRGLNLRYEPNRLPIADPEPA